MSEIVLAVLNMPDELFWCDAPMTRMQHNSIRKEAAKEILELRAENAALNGKNTALWSTLIPIAEALGIDTERASVAPGKPSDVFVSKIEALKAENERLKEQHRVNLACEESSDARIKWANDQLIDIRCERKELYEIISKVEAKNTELLREVEAIAGKAASDMHCLEILNSALKARVAELEAISLDILRAHKTEVSFCLVEPLERLGKAIKEPANEG